MWAKGICDRPIVDKPAAVAKAPFGPKVEWFQRVEIRATTKRNLLTLAKDSMAGTISDIIVLAVGMSNHGLHDSGRLRVRQSGSSLHLRSRHSPSRLPPTPETVYSDVSGPIPCRTTRDTNFATDRLHATRLVSPNPQHSPG